MRTDVEEGASFVFKQDTTNPQVTNYTSTNNIPKSYEGLT